jgi:hypothetical protein
MPPDDDDNGNGQERPGYHPGGTPNTRAFDLIHTTAGLVTRPKKTVTNVASELVGELASEAAGPAGPVVGPLAAAATHSVVGEDED